MNSRSYDSRPPSGATRSSIALRLSFTTPLLLPRLSPQQRPPMLIHSCPRCPFRRCHAAPTHPVVDLTDLELPQAANLVGGHALVGDPRVDRVLCHPKMCGNIFSRQPRFLHGCPPFTCAPGSGRKLQSYWVT